MAIRTPLKAIRAKCLECSNGSSNEVKLCPIKDCALYEYRTGHRPTTGEEKKKNTNKPYPTWLFQKKSIAEGKTTVEGALNENIPLTNGSK